MTAQTMKDAVQSKNHLRVCSRNHTQWEIWQRLHIYLMMKSLWSTKTERQRQANIVKRANHCRLEPSFRSKSYQICSDTINGVRYLTQGHSKPPLCRNSHKPSSAELLSLNARLNANTSPRASRTSRKPASTTSMSSNTSLDGIRSLHFFIKADESIHRCGWPRDKRPLSIVLTTLEEEKRDCAGRAWLISSLGWTWIGIWDARGWDSGSLEFVLLSLVVVQNIARIRRSKVLQLIYYCGISIKK